MSLRKIFIIFFVITLLSSSAFADTKVRVQKQIEIQAPQWSEFCPDEYVNGKYKSLLDYDFESMYTMPYCKSQKQWVKNVNKILILPYLDCWSGTELRKIIARKEIITHNQQQSYWNSRKEQFDKEIATCSSAPISAQVGCYMQVRQLEEQRNNQREQAILAQMQLKNQNYAMLNQSLQNINTSMQLNNINNSLNRTYYNGK